MRSNSHSNLNSVMNSPHQPAGPVDHKNLYSYASNYGVSQEPTSEEVTNTLEVGFLRMPESDLQQRRRHKTPENNNLVKKEKIGPKTEIKKYLPNSNYNIDPK